jgi:NAD(P)-dependent dehydrogenase (short-subunit alcohol dehydrogenase family)
MGRALSGRVCMVTGANSGIGMALSLKLSQNGATVIMACRDRVRGENAQEEVRRLSGNPNIELQIVDVSSQKSIRELAAHFVDKHDKLDVLINNAGVLLFKYVLSEDGIEKTFATNFLGPFLLTNLLMERLRRAPAGRIVNVVSEGTSNGVLDIEKIIDAGDYKAVVAYSQSKQAEILFTYELAERLKGTTVTANCYYPGLVRTNLGKVVDGGVFSSLSRTLMTTLLSFLFTPMEESIKIGMFLATGKTNGMTGKYLMRKKSKIVVRSNYDRNASASVWELAERMTHGSHTEV